jgi:hypothetical protein
MGTAVAAESTTMGAAAVVVCAGNRVSAGLVAVAEAAVARLKAGIELSGSVVKITAGCSVGAIAIVGVMVASTGGLPTAAGDWQAATNHSNKAVGSNDFSRWRPRGA